MMIIRSSPTEIVTVESIRFSSLFITRISARNSSFSARLSSDLFMAIISSSRVSNTVASGVTAVDSMGVFVLACEGTAAKSSATVANDKINFFMIVQGWVFRIWRSSVKVISTVQRLVR